MLLWNKEKLDFNAKDEKTHPHYNSAKFYADKVKYLKDTYGKYMRFVDPKHPRYTEGIDSKGHIVRKMKEPDTVIRIPYETDYTTETGDKQIWSYCVGAPVIHPNGQYDLGRVRSVSFVGDKIISLDKDPDLAFYLTYVSPFVKSGIIKIDDPALDARKLGDKKREDAKRYVAIWNMLTDDVKLRTMASAYGVPNTDKKEPDSIRLELEKVLEHNDQKKKSNPTIRGTDDFLNEMNVNDNILLRSFVQTAIDNKQLKWHADGKWKVGQKIIIQVPLSDIEPERRFDYACNYLGSSNNNDKLLDFLKDILNREYFETIKDPKVYNWLARVSGVSPAFKKYDEIRSKVMEAIIGLE